MAIIEQKKSLDQAQRLLMQLRQDFLVELPDKIDDIEAMILALEQPSHDNHEFEKLFRSVHSLKGTAGTHGITTITFICHQIEDALSEYGDEHRNPELIDILLSYLDLIRQTADAANEESADYAEIHKTLEKIRSRRQKGKTAGLIVEGSSFMSNLYVDSIKNKNTELHVEEDGLIALGRLLREKYDFVIMGAETKSLNGTALLYALRAAGGINRNIKTVVVTSKEQPRFVTELSPDYLLHKNKQLSAQLSETVTKIINTKDSQRSSV